MKLPLKRRRPFPRGLNSNTVHWTSAKPFVENTRGVLIHRPREVSTHTLFSEPHLGVTFLCGNTVSSRNTLTFLDAPPEGKLLCDRCETMALALGMPSADSLVGRHVHRGKVVAVQTCCQKESNHE